MAASTAVVVPPLSLDLLRTFQAVYRLGTMTDAAAALRLSQPSVTNQVRLLEEALGQTLFLRGSRGVQPTSPAHDLAQRVEGHLDALIASTAGLTDADVLTGRTLHLGGPAELLTVRLAPALAGVFAAGVEVRMYLGVADNLLTDLAGGRLDLVVSTVRPRLSGIHAEPLCDEEFALVASPTLVDRLDRQLVITDPVRALDALPLLAYSDDLAITRRWWRHVLGTRPTRRPHLVLPDLRGLLAAAVADLGAAVLPLYLCAEELRSGRLVSVCPTDDPPINTLYLATQTAARQQAHVAHAWTSLRLQAEHW